MGLELSGIRKLRKLAREIELEAREKRKQIKIIKGDIGDVNYPYPPFIRQIRKDIADEKYDHVFGPWNHYTEFEGYPLLRKAIAEYEHVEPENTLPTMGAMGGLATLLFTLTIETKPKVKTIYVANPGFNPYYTNLAKLAHLKIRFYDVKANPDGTLKVEWPDFKDNSVIIVNTPHNPTSGIIKEEDIIELFNLAESSKNVYIGSDSPYSHIWITEEKPLMLDELARKKNYKRFIKINTLSKCVPLSGDREGNIIGPADFIEKAVLVQSSIIVHPSAQSQQLQYFILENRKVMEQHYAEMRKEMRERSRVCEDVLRKNGIEYSKPCTIYTWIKTGANDWQFYLDLLKNELVTLAPGYDFGSNGNGYARWATGALNKEDNREGMTRICKCCQKYNN